MTPGTIGLPGKCPGWYHSVPVKVCSATARTPGSSSTTRSIRRKGSRCGMSASIAALSRVDIAGESRDKEGDHPAVVPFSFGEVASYGVILLILVDQFPRAARVPPQRPNVPEPTRKSELPHCVNLQALALYSLAIQIELPSTAAAP